MLTKPKYQLYSVRVYYPPDGAHNEIFWATDYQTAVKYAKEFHAYDKPVCHNYKKRDVFYDTVAKINAFWRWIDKTDHFYHDLEGWY